MDKEEFQAWKDSHPTQWVLRRLKAISERVDSGLKQRLFLSTQVDPAQWAALQSQAAHDAGYLRAIEQVISLEHEDIEDESERHLAD